MRFRFITNATIQNFGQCFADAETYFFEALKSAGHQCSYLDDSPDFYLIFGWHLRPNWLQLPKEKVIVVQLENLHGSPVGDRFVSDVFDGVRVWDYNKRNTKLYQRKALAVEVFRYGFHPAVMEFITQNEAPAFDGIFYGSMTERRKKILTPLESFASVNKHFNLFGHKLNKEIANSKVVLSPHAYEDGLPASLRIAFALNNDMPVLQEKSSDEAENEYWSRYTFVSSREMFAATFAMLLDNMEEARFRAQRWQRETSMTDNVKDLVARL